MTVHASDSCVESLRSPTVVQVTRDLDSGAATGSVKTIKVLYSNGRNIELYRLSRSVSFAFATALGISLGWVDDVLLRGGRTHRFLRPRAIENDMNVNCHGYACFVSNVPGVVPGVWLEATSSYQHLGESPLQTILDSFFTSVKVIAKNAEATLADDESLQEGDLVLYRNGILQVHSGVVVQVRTGRRVENWVRSKIGIAYTIDHRAEVLGQSYVHDQIEIFRRK